MSFLSKGSNMSSDQHFLGNIKERTVPLVNFTERDCFKSKLSVASLHTAASKIKNNNNED